MKNITLIVWLTQLGLSVAIPPAVFIWLAVWLRNNFGLGNWVIWAGAVLGFLGAVQGFINSVRAMKRMASTKEVEPPLGFNDHE